MPKVKLETVTLGYVVGYHEYRSQVTIITSELFMITEIISHQRNKARLANRIGDKGTLGRFVLTQSEASLWSPDQSPTDLFFLMRDECAILERQKNHSGS